MVSLSPVPVSCTCSPNLQGLSLEQILQMDPAVLVTQSAGVALRTRIERCLKFKIVKICIKRTLLVIVVHLTLTEHHVTHA